MQIDLILPVNNNNILSKSAIEQLNLPTDICCTIKLPNNDLTEINSQEDELQATPSIIEAIKHSAKQGSDAVIVYCFGEPGVKQARQEVNIPVFGIASPAMHTASLLDKQFSVIASIDTHCPLIKDLAQQFKLVSQMEEPISINISPNSISNSNDLINTDVLNQIRHAIEIKKVEAFILGCGSMQGKSNYVAQVIKQQLGYNITIIDPLPTAIYMSYSVVHMGY